MRSNKKGSQLSGTLLASIIISLRYWQLGNLNDANRVCQLNVPFDAMYSFAYQNVQSSTGSSAMLLPCHFGAPFHCHIDHKGAGFAPRFADNF